MLTGTIGAVKEVIVGATLLTLTEKEVVEEAPPRSEAIIVTV
jgi:hypothetical protein